MQKIFYGGNVLTMCDKKPEEAFFVNDENIVFVGSNEEVLKLKTDETELVNLKGKTVCPSFFYLGGSVFNEIEKRLKNAKKDKFIEKISSNNENYDKFCNFDIYLNEFLKIQKELISKGIVLVQETGINEISFTFFKKLSEQKKLKIDIVGYVDIVTSKDVMDNNCRSYRKYQNHFRLAGFSIAIDGSVESRTAWLEKKYKKTKDYYLGVGNVFADHLNFIVKTALEEKRQLVVFASGDRAISHLCSSFENNNKSEIDTMRPLVVGAQLFSKKHLTLAKKFNFSLCVSKQKDCLKQIKNNLGWIRYKRFNNIKFLSKCGLRLAVGKNALSNSPLEQVDDMSVKISKLEVFDSLKSATVDASYVCFEEMNLGTIENGKQASFVILSGNPYQMIETKVLKTYYKGEEIK